MYRSLDQFENKFNAWLNPHIASSTNPAYITNTPLSDYNRYYNDVIDATAVRDDLKRWDLLMYIKQQNLKHVLILNYSNDPLEDLVNKFKPSYCSSYYTTASSTGGYTRHMPGFRGGKIPGTRKTPGRADGEVWE